MEQTWTTGVAAWIGDVEARKDWSVMFDSHSTRISDLARCSAADPVLGGSV